MAEALAESEQSSWMELDLPLSALAALGALPGLTCGPLSALARTPAPAGPPDSAGLLGLLGEMASVSPWIVPALVDPQLSACLIAGNEDYPALHQYAWPDADGRGPGFELAVGDDALTMRGPVGMPDLREELAALLAQDDLPDTPVLTMALSASDFWVLAALSDAYRMTLAARRLSRAGGVPLGVLVSEVLEAWRVGLAERNPGWAVSLFSLLAPDTVPTDFSGNLRETLERMDDADLLMVLEEELSAGPGATVVFGEGLQLLVAGLAGQLTLFGLTVQRVRQGQVELTVMGGWRTPNAVWLVDLSGLKEDQVQLVLASRELLDDLRGNLLGGEPDESFAMETPYTADALRARLSTAGPSEVANATSEVRFCGKCGTKLEAGWKFCTKCKASVSPPNAAPSGNQ